MGVIYIVIIFFVFIFVNVFVNLYRLKSEVIEVYKLYKGRLLKNYKKFIIRKKKICSIKFVLKILCF